MVDVKEKALSIYNSIIDNNLWLKIKGYYDNGVYNNLELNPNRKEIFDFENIVQRINFWMNVYEHDMISEAPTYSTLVSQELNRLLIENGLKDENGNYKKLCI